MRCYRVRRYAENEPQCASRGCLSLAFPQPGRLGRSAAIQPRHTQRVPSGSRTNRSHRAGYTLVFFAMLMFALMGLAALVIDIGFARLTQRQMQTAVDSAALEGLLDAIAPQENGLLVAPAVASLWISTLNELLADPQARHRLGTRAAQYTHEHHHWRLIAARYAAAIGPPVSAPRAQHTST